MRFFDDPTGFDRDLWKQGAELGWTAPLIPEGLGGGTVSGEGVRDVAIVTEELGRALVAGPVLPTNVVAYALARNGPEALTKEHLPALAAGQRVAAWLADPSALDAVPVDGGFRLTGTVSPVQDAHVADLMLVTATTGTGPTTAATGSGRPRALYFCQWTLRSPRGDTRTVLSSGPRRTAL